VTRASRILIVLGAVAALVALVPRNSSTAGPLPACPSTLSVTQSPTVPVNDWTPVPYAGSQRLFRITFRLAADSGELRPDDERNAAGRQTSIWNVEGMKGLQQVCEYSGTLVRLVRPVPGVVKRCEVEAPSASKSGVMSARCE